MSTMMVPNTDFGTLVRHLLTLEVDTQAAFESAATRIESLAYRSRLEEFLANQRQHIARLEGLAKQADASASPGSDAKQVLMRGVMMLANLAGDRAILHALSQGLDDLNAAYAQAITHDTIPPQALGVLQGHFLDERRHRAWLERCLHPESHVSAADETDVPADFIERTGTHPIDFQPPRAH